LLPNSRPHRIAASAQVVQLASDFGNDPQSGIQTTIVGIDDRGIHTEDLGCTLQTVRVIVNNTEESRQVEVGLYPFVPGKMLPKIAHRHAQVLLTGLRRWDDHHTCDAAILWVGFDAR
jgi:hypothetical protein